MRRWERAWFRLWAHRPIVNRPSRPHPVDWFIAAPIRALAWLLNTVQK